MQKLKLPVGHTLLIESYLQMSCADFFTLVLNEGTKFSLETLYQERGEQHIVSSKWQQVDEVYDGLTITEQKTVDLEF